jgi:hypothetical protein
MKGLRAALVIAWGLGALGTAGLETTALASPEGGAPASPSKGTITVPASAVARALEKKDVSATDAEGPDGRPFGARLRGVGRYKTGLHDGDVVVSVEGTRTTTASAMIGAGMAAAAAGRTRITGQIRRGEATYDVVLELPRDGAP